MAAFRPYLSSFPEDSGSNLYFCRYGAYPDLENTTITPELTTGYWTGEGRTFPILTAQTVGLQEIQIPVVYVYSFGQEAALDTDSALKSHAASAETRRGQVEACIQRVEQAMLGKFTLNLGDGYRYQCLLTEIGEPAWVNGIQCVKTYTMAAAKTYPLETVNFSGVTFGTVECKSTVPKTDCKFTFNLPIGGAENVTITVGSLVYGLNDEDAAQGDEVILDGLNKRILVSGMNQISLWTWTDFPYLVPGENKLSIGINGIGMDFSGTLEYYPTFL